MDFDAFHAEHVYMRACEIQSPNSPDFESVLEAVDEDPVYRDQIWSEFLRQRAAYLTQEQVDELRALEGR